MVLSQPLSLGPVAKIEASPSESWTEQNLSRSRLALFFCFASQPMFPCDRVFADGTSFARSSMCLSSSGFFSLSGQSLQSFGMCWLPW